MTIGSNIKQLRKDAGMSQQELADMIGKTRSVISYYESDKVKPRIGAVERMAQAFGVKKSVIVDERVDYSHITLENSADLNELAEILNSITETGRKQLMVFARGIAATYAKEK